MHSPQRLRLANCIRAGLQRELGETIDTRRLLDDGLYARDVLLVCDAFVDKDLALLSAQWRRIDAEPAAPPSQRLPPALQSGDAQRPAWPWARLSNWFAG